MAGIGFSLKRLAEGSGYTGAMRLYGAAGIISSGPWLVSVVSLLIAGAVAKLAGNSPASVERFQTSATWLLGGSLVICGPLQLHLTRVVADLAYANRQRDIAPNVIGAMAIASGLGGLVVALLWPLFAEESVLTRSFLGVGLIVLMNSWLVTGVLGGLREHGRVLQSFALGYAVTAFLCALLGRFGEAGLLFGFVAGQAVLLLFGLHAALTELGLERPIGWGFLRREFLRPELLWIGLLYNLGVWVDKILFWFLPFAGRQVLGPLRASDVYDLPMFVAYLSTVGGMAAFLISVETDFAAANTAFHAAVRQGRGLLEIEALHRGLVLSVRRALGHIGRVQLITMMAFWWLGPHALDWLGLSRRHVPMFVLDTFGVGFQVLLLSATSILLYLDRRREVAWICAGFVAANVIGTKLSQLAGPTYYGAGFAGATALAGLVALWVVHRVLRTLVRDTFMRQPLGGSGR